MTSLAYLALKERIQHDGPLSFSEFFTQALYHPTLGYYAQDTERQGSTGDYITAPTLGLLFSYTIARFLSTHLRSHSDWQVAEIGPGTGALAKKVVYALSELGITLTKYYLVEPLAAPKARLSANLTHDTPTTFEVVDSLPDAFSGVVLVNEVIDALPVDLLYADKSKKISEMLVDVHDHQLVFSQASPRPNLLDAFHSRSIPLYPGYRYEINTSAYQWLADIQKRLHSGHILLMDYGYHRSHYYHRERELGTLTCFHQHSAHSNPLRNPGHDDISVHADFTYLAESACALDLHVSGFFSQAPFLLSQGIADVYQVIRDRLSDIDKAKLFGEMQTLMHPAQMGETMKFMLLSTKRLRLPPSLQSIDRAHILAS
ncbi:MAG: SAM-dependent methyltransferase [Pseudomonadota bacterium]|nr:SAM-dependent methyltransferase [Pseudomonadota bacterium]